MFNKVLFFLKISFAVPSAGHGTYAVVRRNLKIFSQSAWLQTIIGLFEPLVIWVAFGYFLGHWIPEISGINYFAYLLPAVIALSGTQASFYESTLGTQNKRDGTHIYRQWSYTSLTDSEITVGEISWAAMRGWASSAMMIFVAWITDFIAFKSLIEMCLIMALGCYAFAALGFWLSTKNTNNTGTIGLVQVLFILPMFLFSNTFFPLELVLPKFHAVIDVFPMANLMTLLRSSQNQRIDPQFVFALGYLFLWSIIFTNLATHQWSSRYRS